MSWRDEATTTSIAARYAAVGLLAVSALLVPRGTHPSLASTVHVARTYTTALDGDLARVDGEIGQIGGLGMSLASEVADAVESARAATRSAQAALEAVTSEPDNEVRAALDLSDAQVAVDAAAAQVRHVRARVVAGPVADSLGALLAHLDALRQAPTDT
jgi:hypothetical protein